MRKYQRVTSYPERTGLIKNRWGRKITSSIEMTHSYFFRVGINEEMFSDCFKKVYNAILQSVPGNINLAETLTFALKDKDLTKGLFNQQLKKEIIKLGS